MNSGMRHNISDKTKRRIVLILDLLSICAAFSLASKIRFPADITAWQSQLYRTVFGFLLLMWLLIYTFRHVRGHFFDIDRNDAFSNLARVIRDRFILYVILMIFLFGTKAGAQVSRRFLLYLVLLDVGIDYALRMLFRFFLIRSARAAAPERSHILLVTKESQIPIALQRLSNEIQGKPGKAVIAADAIALTGDGETFHSVFEKEEFSLLPNDSFGIAANHTANACDRNSKTIEPARDVPVLILGEKESIPIFPDAFEILNPGKWKEAGFDGNIRKVCIYLPDESPEVISDLISRCVKIGVTAEVCLTMNGTAVPARLIRRGVGYKENGDVSSRDCYSFAEFTDMKARCNVLGVNFALTNAEAAAAWVLGNLEKLKGQYICFSNVHTTVMARENKGYREIQNHSACTFADGAPIASAEHRRGFTEAERCAGPDFMDAVFRATIDGRIGHYFYGSTPETVSLLKKGLEERYPGIRICGVYSPPFRKLEEIPAKEDEADISRINKSGAQIIWIGLGAPKQEEWMALHKDRLNGTMFGVGAGFNFYAGNVKRAPQWMQSAGLEWFYRLCQDPKRLFNRYFVTNIKFVWYMFVDSFKW